MGSWVVGNKPSGMKEGEEGRRGGGEEEREGEGEGEGEGEREGRGGGEWEGGREEGREERGRASCNTSNRYWHTRRQ